MQELQGRVVEQAFVSKYYVGRKEAHTISYFLLEKLEVASAN